MIPKCTNSDCQIEIPANKNFGARFDEATGKWSVFCETHAAAEGLPLRVMNPARMWVVNGGAAAHREGQKAQELAEAKK